MSWICQHFSSGFSSPARFVPIIYNKKVSPRVQYHLSYIYVYLSRVRNISWDCPFHLHLSPIINIPLSNVTIILYLRYKLIYSRIYIKQPEVERIFLFLYTVLDFGILAPCCYIILHKFVRRSRYNTYNSWTRSSSAEIP